ncbi:MAG: hypothetical protein HOJ15_01965 [Candidatus Jacksonbacteria bacterium]|jgi:hypothetical protein|nr:hypothetical protein [Candidatus Jacksonbacteria bacterium]MBT6301173.1 hypothetical protein [Candidatus Jacksonbacteria bacterium]MBT6757646.1 hypothetical protein [Candidatus Jacksonbacteria bacterium]MBT7008332.1 hypothetical protein [Candidatus Jacksonbacteria bacterium]MBT7338874.1 hypothetical protein [Candidatus Jacksonbacteria bacterium]
MRRSPEQSHHDVEAENLDRLHLESSPGWLRYGRIPYKIYYNLDCGSALVGEERLGAYNVTKDFGGGGKSLSIYVHESVPLEFKEFILFHELIEAELALVDGVGLTDAHQQAVDETDKYARKHMSKEEFEGFKEWQDSVVAVDN